MTAGRTKTLLVIGSGLLTLFWTSAVLAQSCDLTVKSTWTAAGGGNYSQTANWYPLIGIPPINDASLSLCFDVNIPANKGTINVDVSGEVDTLLLGDNTVLKVPTGKTYSAIDQSDIHGIIYGNGGDFLALERTLSGNRARVQVDRGGRVEIGNTDYSPVGLNGTFTILLSDGKRDSVTPSHLDLHTITWLNDGFSAGGNSYHQIAATNGGMIDLSGVKAITGPNDTEKLYIYANSDSGINLDSLATITNAGSIGYVSFDVRDRVHLDLPKLSSVGFTQFLAYNGGTLTAKDSPFTYSAAGWKWGTAHLILSDGKRSDTERSLVDLSAMVELDDGVSMSGNSYHQIAATNGGIIDLSGIKTIIGPDDTEKLYIYANSDSSINLDSLATITNAGSIGYVSFDVRDSAHLDLPKLSAAAFTQFLAYNGGTLTAKDSPFVYSAAGWKWGTAQLILSDGKRSDTERSLVDLSAMTELDDGVSMNGSSYHQIVARSGGVIDLSGVKSIVGPGDDEHLTIYANADSNVRLDSLTTITNAGSDYGYVCFELRDNVNLDLPSLSSVEFTQFLAYNGAKLMAKDSPCTYSTAGWKWASASLMECDGAGSLLDLSGITRLDDGFSRSNGRYYHQITARNGGAIDLSGVETLTAPEDNEYLILSANNGVIDLSSLDTVSGSTGTVVVDLLNRAAVSLGDLTTAVGTTITLNGGSALYAGGLRAEVPTTITLRHADDTLAIAGDLNLGGTITISNPGKGSLIVGGDFTYTGIKETDVPFRNSYVSFNGVGPQELEVGGYDISRLPPANDNFAFGDMTVGRDDPNSTSAVVFLVDDIDNGNRGGSYGEAEVLYLYGKDDLNSLHLLNGSVLYMGGLKVYAMVNGVLTNLRTLFAPGEGMIPFDEGYLYLDKPDVNDPRNLIANGGFETGVNPPTAADPIVTLPKGSNNMDHWAVGSDMLNWSHESYFSDAGGGQRFADLSSDTGVASVSQTIPTNPGKLYHVWFDMTATPYGDAGKRALLVSAAGTSEEFTHDAAATPDWQTKTWRFTATEPITTLTFANAGDPNVPFGVAIDNVIVWEPNSVTCDGACGLSISVVGQGTITDPGIGSFEYPCGGTVCVTAIADPNFTFCGWKGTAVDAGMVTEQDETHSTICVTVDARYTLTAVFQQVVQDFPLNEDPGWPRDGLWEFGVPTGQRCSPHGNVDPTSGHTGVNVIGVNLNGCYDPNVGPLYSVVAGPFDLSGYENVELRFWRWLNTDWPDYVTSTIGVATDGTVWSSLWEHDDRDEITDTEWRPCSYRVSQADCQPVVYFRWTYQVVQERAYAYTGWNIDDIQIVGCAGCGQQDE
jgi:choice-of-anchor C domain-containing protein